MNLSSVLDGWMVGSSLHELFLTARTSFLPARCFNEESCLSLKQLEGYLVVLQPDAPQISLSGVGPHLARPAPEFEGLRGVPLFPELRIVCSLSHAVNTAAQGMEGGGESKTFQSSRALSPWFRKLGL